MLKRVCFSSNLNYGVVDKRQKRVDEGSEGETHSVSSTVPNTISTILHMEGEPFREDEEVNGKTVNIGELDVVLRLWG